MGAQGGKDKGKRILLGQVADKYADEVILTSEDPKDEPLILEVTAPINRQFDLALRKVITDLKDSNGNSKLITNEKTKDVTIYKTIS